MYLEVYLMHNNKQSKAFSQWQRPHVVVVFSAKSYEMKSISETVVFYFKLQKC